MSKQRIRYSVLLSIYDRDLTDLAKTLKQLMKAVGGRNDTEFCVVYDFSPGDYEPVQEMCEAFLSCVEGRSAFYDTLKEHPGTFNLDGHSNPVAVNNKLMEMSRGDNVVWVSSDMIVSPFLFVRMDQHIEEDTGLLGAVYSARVIDQDSMAEYCGSTRPFPMMWCIAHPATGVDKHDLELLKGFGYDDNDWIGRMALKFGQVVIDTNCIAIHQTHGKVEQLGQAATGKAYEEGSAPGWARSKAYMQEKWGGNPFDGQTLDIEIGQIGDFIFLDVKGRKDGKDA